MQHQQHRAFICQDPGDAVGDLADGDRRDRQFLVVPAWVDISKPKFIREAREEA